MKDIEKDLIELALSETGGNKKQAAELLRLPRRTFYDKLRQYGMEA